MPGRRRKKNGLAHNSGLLRVKFALAMKKPPLHAVRMRPSLLLPLAFVSFLGACVSGATIPLHQSMSQHGGRIVPDGAIPTPQDLATDAFCAERVMRRAAPRGVVTIFGSARAKEDWESYRITREFARLWTKQMGDRYPILTGGGPGIMEAGNRGAQEAGGKSLFFSHISVPEQRSRMLTQRTATCLRAFLSAKQTWLTGERPL